MRDSTIRALSDIGRGLPLGALIPITLLLLLALVLATRQLRSAEGRFVLVAIWIRLICDGWQIYTLPKMIAGFSLISLASLAVVGAGALIVSPQYWRLRVLMPIYALVAIIAASAAINGDPLDFIEQAIKFGYMIVVFIATYQALRQEGIGRFSVYVLVPFTSLIVFQITGWMLGMQKATERDASVSLIGGFFHESVFSLALCAALTPLCFATRLNGWVRSSLTTIVFLSLLAANYRTTIIAMLPILVYLLAIGPTMAIKREARPIAVSAAVAVLLLGVGAVAGADLGPRVQVLVDFASDPGDLIRPTSEFTFNERHDASGRSYIWSMYYEAWKESPPIQWTIGHGPDSWNGVFRVYAQNTILSYLFEFGILGALAALMIWIVMGLLALSAPPVEAVKLILIHLGFFILNIATMGFWLIEGLLMYGLLCAYTLYFATQTRKLRQVPRIAHHPPLFSA